MLDKSNKCSKKRFRRFVREDRIEDFVVVSPEKTHGCSLSISMTLIECDSVQVKMA